MKLVMKLEFYLFFLVLSSGSMLGALHKMRAPHVVTFFFRPYTDFQQLLIGHEELLQHIAHPGNISHAVLSSMPLQQTIQGIYVTYAGNVTHSNFEGQVLLSLKQLKEEIPVIVTDTISPVLFEGNTVQYFEVASVDHADFYQYKRHLDDTLHAYVWTVSLQPKPSTTQLPRGALIIMANPEDIIIVEGTYITEKSPNFILPDMYVEPSINNAAHVLEFVTINRFMATSQLVTKKDSDRYMQLLKYA